MALRLIIQDEEGATTIVPLGDEEITIGREAGNTIQLTEQNVSRQHARLTLGPDGWILEDLDSYNGIKVNGVSVEGQITLNEGDLVQIGDYHLSLAENVEKTALNLDRPAVAANSQEVGELPAAVLGEPAATGAAVLTPPLTPPQPTYAEPAEEAEPKGRGGLFAALALLVIAAGIGGYFAFGAPSDGPKPKTPETPAVAKGPETPPETPPPPDTPEIKAPDAPPVDPTAGAAVDGDSGEPGEPGDPDDGATATDGDDAPPVETTPTKEPAIKKKTPTSTKKPPADKPPAAPQGDPKELLEKARKASVDGNSAQAYKLAKESYAIEKSAEALKMMGVSACKMGDAAKAQSVYNKVDASTKKALTIVCGQKGVQLVDK